MNNFFWHQLIKSSRSKNFQWRSRSRKIRTPQTVVTERFHYQIIKKFKSALGIRFHAYPNPEIVLITEKVWRGEDAIYTNSQGCFPLSWICRVIKMWHCLRRKMTQENVIMFFWCSVQKTHHIQIIRWLIIQVFIVWFY